MTLGVQVVGQQLAKLLHVGSSTSRSRQAWRPMASSSRFRAKRPLPNIGPRGVVAKIIRKRVDASSATS